MNALAYAVLLTGCFGSDAPDLHELTCTPASLRASGPAPYVVSCDVTFDGSPGDVRWSAYGSDAMYWVRDIGSISNSARDFGEYQFSMKSAQPPPLGRLLIQLDADHVDGIDGPAGDTITTEIQVVP
ncbi:hypothetical protein BH11MYX3_BH11MYX3_47160 [soil metagenome]